MIRTVISTALVAFVVLFAPAAQAQRGEKGIPPVEAVTAKHGMVVSQEARATRIGVEILKQGGNAVDAAVATGFALAVTYPRAGNIGGGGFMVIHLADGKRATTIDYRETAPAATTRTTYLDANGEADPRKSRDLGTAIGVPGTVAGLALAHERYGSGRFTLADLIRPSIPLARKGIPVETDIADSLPGVAARLGRWPSSAKIFMRPVGSVLREGDTLIQGDLADTLEAIAEKGPRAFYEGPIADKIAAAVQKAGGLMTTDDLRDYRPKERAPVRGSYRGFDIVSMPPPSSGGVLLIAMLNMLEAYDLKPGDARTLHLMTEVMKRAYADRSVFLGDPDFVDAPVTGLTARGYADALRATIDPKRATRAGLFNPVNPLRFESENTTHYSVMDRDGNAVSNTYTLNFGYGVGLVAEGTGILLNNELDDFAAKPGAPNAFGLVGFHDANAPGGRKRPLSSMTPTIVLKDGKPVIVTGSPGGSRIITTVLQILVRTLDFGQSVDAATQAPRIHHQWQPDVVRVEPGLDPALIGDLEARGHNVVEARPGTAANTIVMTPEGLVGAADSRTRGALAAGH